MNKIICLLLMCVLLLSTSVFAQEQSPAELVIKNARITTQSETIPEASAFAIADGKFIAVGDEKSVAHLISADTRVIDAAGRRVIPGLIDSHSQSLRGGLSYSRELRWDGVPSLKIGLAMIRDQAARTPKGEWVRVLGGWSPWQFEEKRLPTVAELNEIAPDTPVYIQYFYSIGLLNNKGMDILGIDAQTEDPKGGRFERDVEGNPTGLMLAEPHPGVFYGKIASLPGASAQIEANSTLHLFYELARFGLTGVIDAGGGGFNYPKGYSTAEKLATEGKLPLRTSFYLFPQRPGKELDDFINWSQVNQAGTNTDPFKQHGFELEGGGEYILWEAADFENFRWHRPELPESMEDNLYQVLEYLVQQRWPFKIHATYDESIRRIVAVIERLNEETPLNGLRWSVEHAETIQPQTATRIQALGGGLALQSRMVTLGDDFVEFYGAEKAKRSPPLKTLFESGIPMGMGTDATRGSSFNPWVSLHFMITGQSASGRKLYPDDELLSREQALQVHTLGSAWFSGEEKIKGKIAAGQLADFVVLDQDYFNVSEDKINTIRSVLTVVDGDIVYADEEFADLTPALPPIQPDWSPVKYYGSYYEGE